MWAMIDIETLDVKPTAVVVSIGACLFDVENGVSDTFAILVDMEEQKTKGRTVSIGTLGWWMCQTDKARLWNFNEFNRNTVDKALGCLTTFCRKADLFWSRGSFDYMILEHLYEQWGQGVPWGFNRLRDVRSLDELDQGAREKAKCQGHTAHKPLDDCFMQVAQVRDVFKRNTPRLGPFDFGGPLTGRTVDGTGIVVADARSPLNLPTIVKREMKPDEGPRMVPRRLPGDK